MSSQEFYLIVLPGLEDLAISELRRWYPSLDEKSIIQAHGGVTVFMSLNEGLGMNLALKIPTRILLRMGNFKCRDFPKLFQKISKWDWKKWMDPGCELSVVVSSSTSRLNMKKRIEETVLDGWKAYQKKQGAGGAGQMTLYVRLKDDVCHLSLDTSGEKLHKRSAEGEKWVGKAPLRETIAAAMVELMFFGGKNSSGISGEGVIADPMMGSGTFLLEALSYSQLSPREFSFENLRIGKVMLPSVEKLKISGAVGIEKDPKTLKAAQENFERVGLGRTLKVIQKDFMKMKSADALKVDFVFCNPPYGKRIKVDGPLKEFYEKLFVQIEAVLKPKRLAVIIPTAPIRGKLALPLGWKVLELVKTTNGGIPVGIYLFGSQNPLI